MHQTRKPLEELAIDLLFESFGEHRYNRTPQEYEHLCSLIPPLKQAHHPQDRHHREREDRAEQKDAEIAGRVDAQAADQTAHAA